MDIEKLVTLLVIPAMISTAIIQILKMIPWMSAKSWAPPVVATFFVGPAVVWLFAEICNLGDLTLKMTIAFGIVTGLSSVGLFEIGKRLPAVNTVVKILLLLLLPLCLAGCSGIVADARHAALIDTTAAVMGSNSTRADKADICTGPGLQILPPCECVGEFSKAEIRDILKSNAEIWRYFRQAKMGQGTFPAGLE